MYFNEIIEKLIIIDNFLCHTVDYKMKLKKN